MQSHWKPLGSVARYRCPHAVRNALHQAEHRAVGQKVLQVLRRRAVGGIHVQHRARMMQREQHILQRELRLPKPVGMHRQNYRHGGRKFVCLRRQGNNFRSQSVSVRLISANTAPM